MLSAAILFLIPRVSELSFLIGLSILLGVSSALAIPAIGALVAVEGRKGRMGELMGTLSAAKSSGRIVGPLLSGAIYDLFGGGIGGISMAFSLAAILSLFSLLIFLLLEKEEILAEKTAI